jgi:hypothetical protein
VKYDLIIENNLKTVSLRKVRIKVDPKLVSQEADLSKCDGYEGFILAETGDVPKVLVMSPDGVSSVMDIPQQFLQTMFGDEESQALTAFKEYICDVCELDMTTPEAEMILSANTIEEIESLLKTAGLLDDEIKVIYRNFIASSDDVVTEGAFSALLNRAAQTITPGAALKGIGNVARAAGGIVKGAAKAYDVLGGGNTVIGGAGQKLGSAIQAPGKFINKAVNSTREFIKKLKDEGVKQAIKKLERPPDGKDIVNKDQFTIELPTVSKTPLAGVVWRVQGNTDSGKLIASLEIVKNESTSYQSKVNKLISEATPAPTLPFNEIDITDTGSTNVNIGYFNDQKQIPIPEVKKNSWPTTAGLHKIGPNRWLLNQDVKDDGLLKFTTQILATLKIPTIKAEFKEIKDDQINKLALGVSDYEDIQKILGLPDDRYNQLLGLWAKNKGPGTSF